MNFDLSQVCDSEWHHLSLSVQFPSVTLYVDGVTFDPALIHDNGAIPNPAPHQRLVIGACWGNFSICCVGIMAVGGEILRHVLSETVCVSASY